MCIYSRPEKGCRGNATEKPAQERVRFGALLLFLFSFFFITVLSLSLFRSGSACKVYIDCAYHLPTGLRQTEHLYNEDPHPGQQSTTWLMFPGVESVVAGGWVPAGQGGTLRPSPHCGMGLFWPGVLKQKRSEVT